VQCTLAMGMNFERMSKASGKIVQGKSKSTLAVPGRAYRQVIGSGVDLIVHGHIHDSYQRRVNADGRQGEVLCFGWKEGKRNFIHFEG